MMRSVSYLAIAVLTIGLSVPAAAQTDPSQPLAAAATAQTTTSQTTTAQPTAVVAEETRSHWLASATFGSPFSTGSDASDLADDIDVIDDDDGGFNFNFGLQLGYLWNGAIGLEAVAEFSPSMDVSNVAFEDEPGVNSYMLNLIGAIPLGPVGQFQPYISGGFGSVQMLADVVQFVQAEPLDSNGILEAVTTRHSETRFGGNIGGGLMAFGENVGFRTDIRFFRAAGGDLPTEASPGDQITQAALSGLNYWRANVGIGFKW